MFQVQVQSRALRQLVSSAVSRGCRGGGAAIAVDIGGPGTEVLLSSRAQGSKQRTKALGMPRPKKMLQQDRFVALGRAI